MKNSDSHIWLYAKHWYKVTSYEEDLRIILAHRNGVEPKYITRDIIILILTNIVFPYMTSQKFYELNSMVFLSFRRYEGFTEFEQFLYELLHILCDIKVKESDDEILIPLDEPDYNILPKRED